jgi:hypothetical protein
MNYPQQLTDMIEQYERIGSEGRHLTLPKKFIVTHPAFFRGIHKLRGLKQKKLAELCPGIDEPLCELYEYMRSRIVHGKDGEQTGRDRNLPGSIEQILNNSPDITNLELLQIPECFENTDLAHTAASVKYAWEIGQKELSREKKHINEHRQKMLMAAIIVHDCAYPKTENFKDFTSAETRVKHMENAVIEFKYFAKKIDEDYNKIHGKPYFRNVMDEVCHIVEQHDKPSVPTHERFRDFFAMRVSSEIFWVHREADRLWMLDEAGFALDLARRLLEDNPWYNPEKYLNHVVKQHQKESKVYIGRTSCRQFQGENTLYRTDAGFETFKRLVAERKADYCM